jgi:FtsH-binding integral membrane protein
VAVREVAALSLAGTACGVVGGGVFWLANGSPALTRSIGYGCWLAATVLLVLTAVAAQKVVWRRTSLPVPEGWMLVTAAIAVTAVGAVVDWLGT